VKIKEIRAATIDLRPRPTTRPRVPKLQTEGFVSPMARYPEFRRADWTARWTRTACVVTAEDGTWGLGSRSTVARSSA
jgi:L-rhamnonate dehydratase